LYHLPTTSLTPGNVDGIKAATTKTTCTTSLKVNLLFLNYPRRQGNNPGLFGEVFSLKVGNRVGIKKREVKPISLTP
jgi:hypothetical protein